MCFRRLFSFGCRYLRGNPTKMTQNTQNMGTEPLKEYHYYVPNMCLQMYCMCIYRYVYIYRGYKRQYGEVSREQI